MKKLIYCVFLLLFIPASILALGEEWVEKQVRANKDVILYATLPQGLYCSKGEHVAVIQSGEVLRVLDHRKVNCALIYTYDFIEVERMKEGLSDRKKRGFVAVKNEAGEISFRLIE